MELSDRLKLARKNLGLSQKALADAAGVTQQMISKIERGDQASTTFLVQLAEALQISAKWLTTGQGPMRQEQRQEDAIPDLPNGFRDSELQPGPDLPKYFRRIPVVGTAQLGPDGYWTETGYPVGKGEGYVEFFSRDPNAYALRVQGDSMSPTIRSGWFVIAEPNSAYIPGSYVVVCTKDERCMVKEFLFERNGEFAFASVNDNYGRLTLVQDEVEKIHPVSAIIAPQKFKPW